MAIFKHNRLACLPLPNQRWCGMEFLESIAGWCENLHTKVEGCSCYTCTFQVLSVLKWKFRIRDMIPFLISRHKWRLTALASLCDDGCLSFPTAGKWASFMVPIDSGVIPDSWMKTRKLGLMMKKKRHALLTTSPPPQTWIASPPSPEPHPPRALPLPTPSPSPLTAPVQLALSRGYLWWRPSRPPLVLWVVHY